MTDIPQNTPGGELQPGSLFANRFEVLSRVAAGGMGVVYKVKDTALSEEVVALKLLHPQYSENKVVLKRFLNEVRVARALSHPHIVRIHDFGTAETGQVFITMEYVSGQNLSKLISSIFPEDADVKNFGLSEKSFKKLAGIFQQILEAISYAHKRGIIHRDLKPANILISEAGEIKVADFGTARILGNSSTITVEGQSSLGTPQYMSPEQVRGDELDKSCDIYALGMMAYELVTGHPPFYGIAPLSVMYKQLNETIQSFANEERGIPIWWQTLVLKATEKEKKARFPDVDAMIEVVLEQTGNARSYVANPPTIEGIQISIKKKPSLFLWASLAAASTTAMIYFLSKFSAERQEVSVPYLPPSEFTTLATAPTTPPTPIPMLSPTLFPAPSSLPTAHSVDPVLPVVTFVPKAVNPVERTIGNLESPNKAARENYQGNFSRAISGDTSSADRTLKMQLSYNNDQVSGTAALDGKRFNVAGQRTSQGMQLTLKDSSSVLQLSGAFRPGGYLRGTYYFPLTNSRGSWTVKLDQ